MYLLNRCPMQHSPLRLSVPLPLFLILILFAARPQPLHATTPEQTGTTETFPVKRLVHDIREAGLQTVGRDGPRYPDDGFLSVVRKFRGAHTPSSFSSFSSGDKHAHDQCAAGFIILTMGNNFVMENLMPLLLESLRRIELPAPAADGGGAGGAASDESDPDNLARHTVVVGVNQEAMQACIRLRRGYKNGCLSDALSGLHEGDLTYPSFTFLSYGMAKLKYIVNSLSTGAAVLWLDADVVLLRNPLPDLLASAADVAVATASAPCGTTPSEPDWAFIDGEEADEDAFGHHHAATGHHHAEDEQHATTHGTSAAAAGDVGHAGQHQKQVLLRRQHRRRWRHRALLGAEDDGGAAAGAGAATGAGAGGYAPGITFYRSSPGVMRCAYSLLLDMLNVALKDANATVLEQEHFAAFMPTCMQALGLTLAELPQQHYLTAACTAGGTDAVLAAAAVTTSDGDVSASGGGADSGRGSGVVAVHVSGGVLGRGQRERLALMEELVGASGSDLMEAAAHFGEGSEGGEGGTGTEAAEATVIAASEFVQP